MKKGSWSAILSIWVATLAIIALAGTLLSFVSLPFSVYIVIQEVIVITIVYFLNQSVLNENLLFDWKIGFNNSFLLNIPAWLLLVGAINIVIAKFNFNHFTLALTVAICAGVTEEYVFRGILLPAIIKRIGGKSAIIWGTLISSFLFGITHMVNISRQPLEPTLVQGVNAMILGLFLAALYLRTHNLFWPMLFHAINDFGAVYVNGTATYTSNLNPLNLIGSFIFFGGIAFVYLRKTKQPAIIEKFNFQSFM